MAHIQWPDADRTAELLRQLRSGDTLASSDFATAFLDPLVAHLRAANPQVDEDLLYTAAGDAVLSVIHNPEVYDPARRDLPGFLRMAACGDLKNARQKEWRHQRNRDGENLVELAPDTRNSSMDDDDLPSFDDPRLTAVIATFTETERQVFELMRDGERDTEPFAAVQGITDRPVAEQKQEVYRMKDRIKKRLKRAVEGS